uniref:Putative secreted protein n=1 Tax=Anopheles triannulatus TaxID=58253 RepID=A0A2M4B5A6_9DIPT
MYLLPVRCWLICIICKQAYSTNENNNYIYMTMASLSACARACVFVNAACELLTMAPPAVAEEKGETRRLRSRNPSNILYPAIITSFISGRASVEGFRPHLPMRSSVEHACVEHSIRICRGRCGYTLFFLSATHSHSLSFALLRFN